MTEGRKFDANKPRPELISAYAQWILSIVMAAGAVKYGDRNWEQGIDMSRLLAADKRHTLLWEMGEDIDPESGLPHLAHKLANAMMLVHMAHYRPERDDRPKYTLGKKLTKQEVEEVLNDNTELLDMLARKPIKSGAV